MDHQLLASVSGCSTVNSECATCKLTYPIRLDQVIAEKRWYPGFIGKYEERSVVHFTEKSHP